MNQHHSQYTLVRKLGEGGMGAVYLAEDTLLERQVAIKELHTQARQDGANDSRFQQEALALAKLNHPSITHLYNFFPKDESYWMIMEYVHGRTLEDWLRMQGQLSPLAACSIMAQAAEGLSHAHKKGIIHRDLKPANIMISDEGEVKIMDFGIARMRNSQRMTQHGKSVGTLEYMAPEQIQGHEGDERTDIYAAGNILYELLCGQPPFRSDTDYHLMKAKLEQKPPAMPAHIPVMLQQAVYRSLETSPEKRFTSIAEFKAALQGCMTKPLLRQDQMIAGIAENSSNGDADMNVVGKERDNRKPLAAFGLLNKLKQADWNKVGAGLFTGLGKMKIPGVNNAVWLLVAVIIICAGLLTWNHFRKPGSTETITDNVLPAQPTDTTAQHIDSAATESQIIENQISTANYTPPLGQSTLSADNNAEEKDELPAKKKSTDQKEKTSIKKETEQEATTEAISEPEKVEAPKQSYTASYPVKIPAGRNISLVLDETISSEEPGRDGSVVRLRCAEDIEVSGRVIIKKGAIATGKIVDVVPSGNRRKKAVIGFVIHKVQAVDGSDVKLKSDRFRLIASTEGVAAIYQAGQSFRAELGRGVVE